MVQKTKNIHGGPGNDSINSGPGCDTARATGSFLDYRITFHKKDLIVVDLRPDARDDADFVNATGERSVTLATREAL